MRRADSVLQVLATLSTGAAIALTVHAEANARHLRLPAQDPPIVDERVSVLLPARDEAERIAPTLRALLAQERVPDLEILVLDDGSSDGTADIVRSVVGEDPRVRVIAGDNSPLPEGWLGKPWACQRLASLARGSVLVFIDADVRCHPTAVAGLVDLLRCSNLDLISPYPRQQAFTVVERLVQPLVVWSWLTTLPLGPTERAPFASLAAAAGQLLAVDAQAYQCVGGHGAVRGEVLEDVALLRAFKRSGLRGVPTVGSALADCRMYDGARQVYAGYTKSLWSAFGSPAGAALVLLALCGVYVLPAVLTLTARRPATRWIAATGYAAGVVGRALVARRTGEAWFPDAAAHPASITALAGLTTASFVRRRRGGLTWKGRAVG